MVEGCTISKLFVMMVRHTQVLKCFIWETWHLLPRISQFLYKIIFLGNRLVEYDS